MNVQSQLTEALSSLTAELRRSTVQVRDGRGGTGSGIIWQPDGLIVTNAHVVRGKRVEVELEGGQILTATVDHRDDSVDLATLRVSATDLPTASIGDSDQLRVGELVIAIGNPLGLVGAVTAGIIHSPPDLEAKQPWVQADVRLAPGNSGGPLINANGQVIGVNSMIVNGLAIAIPSNTVHTFVQQAGQRPLLGATLQPVRLNRSRRGQLGLLVLEIAASSPAEGALLPGDVLLGVDGEPLRSPWSFSALVSHSTPGDRLTLNRLRGGRISSVTITLGQRSQHREAT